MGDLTYAVIGFLIMIGIFLMGREIYCWYFKINERVKKMDEMISLLTDQNKFLYKIIQKTEENNVLLKEFENNGENNNE